jgi:hypothetical protein
MPSLKWAWYASSVFLVLGFLLCYFIILIFFFSNWIRLKLCNVQMTTCLAYSSPFIINSI